MNNDDYSWMARSGHPAAGQRPPWDIETVPHAWADTDTMTAPPPVPARYTPTAVSPAVKEDRDDDHDSRRGDDPGLRRARARASRPRRSPVVTPDVAALTLTAVVPVYNGALGLAETLHALRSQTTAPDRVIVIDDGSTDNTSEIARSFGVEVFRREQRSGSKSRALNHVLMEIGTDLVLNVDDDTVLCEDYVKRIKCAFADPQVAVAAGIVQVWNPKGVLQRGRQVEYLLGQHLYRPIQNFWSSPTVCPGAACAYRRAPLAAAGGFPDDTVAEDMAYTWQMMLTGYKAVYVAGAECYVIDPRTPQELGTQLWRWMSGYFQCVRLNWREVTRRKKVLALLILASMWDIVSLPLWLVSPLVLAGSHGRSFLEVMLIALFGTDLAVTVPVVAVAAVRRGINPLRALANVPLIWVMRAFNFWYSGKAMLYELVLVPCQWKASLSVFKKGHA
jgi:N-acetylglucosaminyltransferase